MALAQEGGTGQDGAGQGGAGGSSGGGGGTGGSQAGSGGSSGGSGQPGAEGDGAGGAAGWPAGVFHHPVPFVPREPVRPAAPVIPAYLGGPASAVTPADTAQEGWLRAGLLAGGWLDREGILPPVQEQADLLGRHPYAIYAWVRDNVRYVPYYGLMRGPVGTLWAKEGNDLDQAALLVALLRASGVPARYVGGVVRFPKERLVSWTGIQAPADAVGEAVYVALAVSALQGNGVPVRLLDGAGDPAASVAEAVYAEVEHYWVEAFVGGVGGSGAGGGSGGDSGRWISLDPSFKEQMRLPGARRPEEWLGQPLSEVTAGIGSFVYQVDAGPGVPGTVYGVRLDDLESWRKDGEQALRAAWDARPDETRNAFTTYGGWVVRQGWEAGQLGFTEAAVSAEFSEVPPSLQHRVRAEAGGASFEAPVAALVGRPLSLLYLPADAEAALAQANGLDVSADGRLMAPLTEVRPAWALDGAVAAVGEAVYAGEGQRLTVTFTAPGAADEVRESSVITGSIATITFTAGPAGEALIRETQRRLVIMQKEWQEGLPWGLDEPFAPLYFSQGVASFFQADQRIDALEWLGRSALILYPSALLVGSRAVVVEREGRRYLLGDGVRTDFLRSAANAYRLAPEGADPAGTVAGLGHWRLVFEAPALLAVPRYPALGYALSSSTPAALAAALRGPGVQVLGPEEAAHVGHLGLAPAVAERVYAALAAGFGAVLPAAPVTLLGSPEPVRPVLFYDPATGAVGDAGPGAGSGADFSFSVGTVQLSGNLALGSAEFGLPQVQEQATGLTVGTPDVIGAGVEAGKNFTVGVLKAREKSAIDDLKVAMGDLAIPGRYRRYPGNLSGDLKRAQEAVLQSIRASQNVRKAEKAFDNLGKAVNYANTALDGITTAAKVAKDWRESGSFWGVNYDPETGQVSSAWADLVQFGAGQVLTYQEKFGGWGAIALGIAINTMTSNVQRAAAEGQLLLDARDAELVALADCARGFYKQAASVKKLQHEYLATETAWKSGQASGSELAQKRERYERALRNLQKTLNWDMAGSQQCLSAKDRENILRRFGLPGRDRPDDTFDLSTRAGVSLGIANPFDLLVRLENKDLPTGKEWADLAFYNFLAEAAAIDPVQFRQLLLDASAAAAERRGRIAARLEQALDDLHDAADVAVLATGFASNAAAALETAGIRYKVVAPEFDPQEILRRQKVLLIPSGGLAGLSASELFRRRLVDYVYGGGRLLVFTQPTSAEWAALPGAGAAAGEGPPGGCAAPSCKMPGWLSAFGWQEDTGWFTTTRLDAEAARGTPLMALVRSSPLGVGSDGFFVSLPDGGRALTTEAASGRPTTVLYPVGEGWVLATSTFTDWKAMVGGLNPDERTWLQLLLRWAESGFRAGLPALVVRSDDERTNVAVEVTVQNRTGRAARAELEIVDPQGRIPPEPFPARMEVGDLAPGEMRRVSAVVELPARRDWPPGFDPSGAWWVNAVLRDEAGVPVQRDFQVAGFVVVTSPGLELSATPDVEVRLTADRSFYAPGQVATLVASVANRGSRPRSLRLLWNCPEGGDEIVNVAPGANLQATCRLRVFSARGNIWGHGLRVVDATDNTTLARLSTTLFVRWTPAQVALTDAAEVPPPFYRPGSAVTLKAAVATGSRDTAVRLRLRLATATGQEVASAVYDVTTDASGRAEQLWTVRLPEEGQAFFVVRAEAFTPDGQPLGGGGLYLPALMPRAEVRVSAGTLEPGARVPVQVAVYNRGAGELGTAPGDRLALTLRDPRGQAVWNEVYEGYYVPEGGVWERVFEVPLPPAEELSPGDWRLEYQLNYGDRGLGGSAVWPHRVEVAFTPERGAVAVGEAVYGRLILTNAGDFGLPEREVAVEVPSLGLGWSARLAAGSRETVSEEVYLGLVPHWAGEGSHPVVVRYAGREVGRGSIALPPARLALALPDAGTAGQPLAVRLVNLGGGGAAYELSARLQGQGRTVTWPASGTISGWVYAGETREEPLVLPGDLWSGRYRLEVQVHWPSGSARAVQDVAVAGLERPRLDATADLGGAAPQVTASVYNPGRMDLDGLQLALEAPGSAGPQEPLRGRVLDAESGQPVAGALVRVAPPAGGTGGSAPAYFQDEVHTDVLGGFRLRERARGAYWVEVRHPGYLPWRGMVPADGFPVTVRLEPAGLGEAEVQVLDEAGEPLTGAEVRLEPEFGGGERAPAVAWSGWDGRAHLRWLPAGIYRVTVSLPRRAEDGDLAPPPYRPAVRQLTVNAGETAALRVSLEPEAVSLTVRAYVYDAETGRPLGGARLLRLLAGPSFAFSPSGEEAAAGADGVAVLTLDASGRRGSQGRLGLFRLEAPGYQAEHRLAWLEGDTDLGTVPLWPRSSGLNPVHDAAHPTPLTLDTPTRAALDRAGDEHFYVLRFSHGGALTVRLDAGAGAAAWRPRLRLWQGLDAAQPPLATADASADGRATLSRAVEPGEYLLAVSDRNGTGASPEPYLLEAHLDWQFGGSGANDAWERAVSLSLPGVAEGYLFPAYRGSWYRVEVPAYGVLRVRLEQPRLVRSANLYVELYNSAGQYTGCGVGPWYAAGQDGVAEMGCEVGPGTWYVRVAGTSSQAHPFRLRVGLERRDTGLGNDAWERAVGVSLPGVAEGYLFPGYRGSWYRVEVPVHGVLRVRLEQPRLVRSANLYVELYNSAGQYTGCGVGPWYAAGQDGVAEMGCEVGPGTWYVRVAGTSSQAHPFRLRVGLEQRNEGLGARDLGSAFEVSPNHTVHGYLFPGYQQRWYKVVPQGSSLTAVLEQPRLVSSGYLYVQLYNSAGQYTGCGAGPWYSGGTNGQAQITCSVTPGSAYYVKVYATSSQANPFTLTLGDGSGSPATVADRTYRGMVELGPQSRWGVSPAEAVELPWGMVLPYYLSGVQGAVYFRAAAGLPGVARVRVWDPYDLVVPEVVVRRLGPGGETVVGSTYGGQALEWLALPAPGQPEEYLFEVHSRTGATSQKTALIQAELDPVPVVARPWAGLEEAPELGPDASLPEPPAGAVRTPSHRLADWLLEPGQVNRYRYRVVQGGTLRLEARPKAGQPGWAAGPVPLRLRLLDGAGERELGRAEAVAPGETAVLERILCAGRYVIEVSSPGGAGAAGPYTLVADWSPATEGEGVACDGGTLAVPAGGTVTQAVYLPRAAASGRQPVRVRLGTAAGEEVGEARFAYWAAGPAPQAHLESERTVWRRGEAIPFTLRLLGGAEPAQVAVRLEAAGEASGAWQTLWADTLSLGAGEERAVPLQVPATLATEPLRLEVYLSPAGGGGSAALADALRLLVAEPLVRAAVEVPDEAGPGPQPATLHLANEGPVPARLRVRLAGEAEDAAIVLEPGGAAVVTRTARVGAGGPVRFEVRGDVPGGFMAVEKLVRVVFRGSVRLDPETVYEAGVPVAVRVYVRNDGSTTAVLPVRFTLRPDADGACPAAGSGGGSGGSSGSGGGAAEACAGLEREYEVAPGGEAADVLVLPGLPAGRYTLAYEAGTLAGQAPLQVAARDDVRLEVSSFPAEVSGPVTAEGAVRNAGFNRVEGWVRLITPIGEAEQPLALDPGGSATFRLTAGEGRPLAEGEYAAQVIVEGNGRELVRQELSFREVARLEVTGLPAIEARAGETVTAAVYLRNAGGAAGRAEVRLHLPGFPEQVQSVAVAPGEEIIVPFTLNVPDDVVDDQAQLIPGMRTVNRVATAPAYVEVNGRRHEIPFRVRGLQVAVEAALDRPAYRSGEEAVLTLRVTGTPGEYVAFAQLNAYDERKPVTVPQGGAAEVSFRVPVDFTQKLQFGVNTPGGRALYLNALYLREAGAALRVVLDRQVARPGEAVAVAVYAAAPGQVVLTAPGPWLPGADTTVVRRVYAAGEELSLAFTVPDLTAGSYAVAWSFAPDGAAVPDSVYALPDRGEVFFDVDGARGVVLSRGTDRAEYRPGEPVTFRFTVDANRDMDVVIVAYLPVESGGEQPVFSQRVRLHEGANVVEVQRVLPEYRPGLNLLRYEVWYVDPPPAGAENLLLMAQGELALDVAGLRVAQVGTDRSAYRPGDQVRATVSLEGRGTGRLRLFLDGTPVAEREVAADGYATIAFDLGAPGPGVHMLRAELAGAVGPGAAAETGFDVTGLALAAVGGEAGGGSGGGGTGGPGGGGGTGGGQPGGTGGLALGSAAPGAISVRVRADRGGRWRSEDGLLEVVLPPGFAGRPEAGEGAGPGGGDEYRLAARLLTPAEARARLASAAGAARPGVRVLPWGLQLELADAAGRPVTDLERPVWVTVYLDAATLAGLASAGSVDSRAGGGESEGAGDGRGAAAGGSGSGAGAGVDPGRLALFRLDGAGRPVFAGGFWRDGTLRVWLHHLSEYLLAEVRVEFVDLGGHWARPDAELLGSKYSFLGVGGGRFAPGRPITRAEMAAALVRVLGVVSGEEELGAEHGASGSGSAAPTLKPFADVPPGAWYARHVAAAARTGLVLGHGDGSFRPEAPLSRGEALLLLARAERYLYGEGESTADTAAARDVVRAAAWARERGILRGRPVAAGDIGAVGTLAPAANVPYTAGGTPAVLTDEALISPALRAEAAAMLARWLVGGP